MILVDDPRSILFRIVTSPIRQRTRKMIPRTTAMAPETVSEDCVAPSSKNAGQYPSFEQVMSPTRPSFAHAWYVCVPEGLHSVG